MSEPVYRFGRFGLDSGLRRLFKDGEPVTVGARAFDILHVLLRHRDRFVPKEESFGRSGRIRSSKKTI
jgi:DNA-binding winged helix-turn-helix (wHTH) protein